MLTNGGEARVLGGNSPLALALPKALGRAIVSESETRSDCIKSSLVVIISVTCTSSDCRWRGIDLWEGALRSAPSSGAGTVVTAPDQNQNQNQIYSQYTAAFTGTTHGNTDCYLQFCAPPLPPPPRPHVSGRLALASLLLGRCPQTRALLAFSRRDVSADLTWRAHRRNAE